MFGLKQKLLVALLTLACSGFSHAQGSRDYEGYAAAKWDPIHFKPAIESATNEQCLSCHQDIIEDTPLEKSPAGLSAEEALAWYQTLSTYTGKQESFHRRHMETEFASELMELKCNTCHQGNDPREEVSESAVDTQADLTMRKQVDPYICAMCHSQNNYQRMGMPSPWEESKNIFGNSCLTCHVAIKPERHQGIDFLKAENIEKLGTENSDVCYGCHGGRAWYDIYFPYSEKRWPGWGEAPIGSRHKYLKSPSGVSDAQANTTK